MFREGRRWAAANKYLSTLDLSEPYPLLLGDAASINGVEWVAMIENIELFEDGTNIHFSNLVELKVPIPLNDLLKVSDRKALDQNYIRTYLPCIIEGDVEQTVLSNLFGVFDDESENAFEIIESLTSDDFVSALKDIEDEMTEKQRAMLLGHAKASGHVLSMRAIADIAGYAKFQSANMQYGALGRKFANYFHVSNLPNQTQAMAWSDGAEDNKGHFAWTLRAPLVEALYVLGWIKRPTSLNYALMAAAIEIDADQKCSGITETTRQALIEARVGQGKYRNNLLKVWAGKCAVTGSDLNQVLVASHAKPWSECSNEERLDEFNGLLLVANIDKLFDSGLISFADDGSIHVGPLLTPQGLMLLGLSTKSRLTFVDERHKSYLRFHREKFRFE